MPETIVSAEPGMAAADEPEERECLLCYLGRTLRRHGCDNTHRWTVRWRDRRFPGNEQLLTELADRGGCCCDCEVTMNVWEEDAWEEEEAAAAAPAPCDGTASKDPLDLCARWAGYRLRAPGDPYEDEDDYQFRCSYE